MSSLRKRLSYANITATLALLFAMSGGALAASHYVITSTKQISPKVRKQLQGAQGAKGPAGTAGPQGAAGAAGATGAAGTAVAYGQVAVSSIGNPTFSVNVGFSSVTEPQPGEFCVDPVYAGHPPIVSPGGAENIFTVVSPQQCPGGYEIVASAAVGSGTGFDIVVP